MPKFKGKAKASLQAALEEAYKEGMKNKQTGGGKTFKFKVVEIHVEGQNPPTDYIVELEDA